MSLIDNFVEVGTAGGEVVINLKKGGNSLGHLVFSPNQARELASVLLKKAGEAEGK